MSIPLIQQYRIGKYLLRQKLSGHKRYPLVLMLEPLFQCNLACAGCGKIDYEKDILQRRMSVTDALQAVDDCDAPVVSIPGGEPLIHKELPQIVAGIVARRKFVYLCTNALLVPKHIDEYQPSPYLTFSIHLDGLQRQHDASVCQEGVFEKAVAAIRLLRERKFRVTVNCTLFAKEDPDEVAEFFDFAMGLGVEAITGRVTTCFSAASRASVCSAKSSRAARPPDAAGCSITPACTWISWPAIRAISARLGAIRPITSSAGSGRVT
jgi:hopanoid biosynthesis associated radical SAM protein HpnH